MSPIPGVKSLMQRFFLKVILIETGSLTKVPLLGRLFVAALQSGGASVISLRAENPGFGPGSSPRGVFFLWQSTTVLVMTQHARRPSSQTDSFVAIVRKRKKNRTWHSDTPSHDSMHLS